MEERRERFWRLGNLAEDRSGRSTRIETQERAIRTLGTQGKKRAWELRRGA